MNPLMKGGKMLVPPPRTRDEKEDDDSVESDDSGPPVTFATKGKLKRQDTFYDVNYESVKVSTVPKSQEGWAIFMDMLKTEHRKFKMLYTTLRIERTKILKEFEAFKEMFENAKEHIRAQFELTMTDLKSVNCARLLNGEINKRSTSFIKTPTASIKSSIGRGKSLRHSSMSTSNIHKALYSVRETFGGNEEADEEEGDFDDEGMSGKSSFSSRFPRPSIPMEYDVDDKTERRNKLRQKSSVNVNVFHASTQTVDLNPVLATGPSASSRLERFRKDSTIAETFQSHKRPHALSQPFLGYIRRHEKTYARELGLMRIALREFKGIYDHIKFHLDSLMNSSCAGDASPALLKSLHHMQMMLTDGNWVFDPKFFMRKVQMNPLEDPIDVSAQAEMINSYNVALSQNDADLKQAQENNDIEQAQTLSEVKEEMQNLLIDLNGRVKEKGGWRALLYTTTGAVDLTMSLKPWTAEEQALILQEKLRYVQLKSAEQETEHEKVMKHLHEALEQAHNKHSIHSSHYGQQKGKGAHPQHTAHGHSKHTQGRSNSISGASSTKSSITKNTTNNNNNNNNTMDAQPATALATSPRRHSSAVTGESHPHDTAVPATITAAGVGAGGAAGTDAVTQSTITAATVDAEPSVDDLMQNVPSLDAYRDLPSSPKHRLPPGVESHLQQVLGTLNSLRSALESSQHTQSEQQRRIEHLEKQLRQASMLQQPALPMSDDLSEHMLLSASGPLDGENSILSHASNEILDEYQQIGLGAHHNSFNNSFNSNALHSSGIALTGEAPANTHNLTSHQVAAGTVGISAGGARRGSTLVMHRDRGEGNQIEYVPMGKVVTNQALRITVNNEQRDHRHLLLRPSSASTAPSGAKKSFASVMGTTAVGGKGPVDKFRQMEIQHRRDLAMQMRHSGQATIGTPLRAGLFPIAGSSPDVMLPVPTMRPPSPQQLKKMSDKALIHELSTIMDSRGNSPHSSPGRRLSPGPSERRASPPAATHSRTSSPPKDTPSVPSPEALLATLQELCQNLQLSLTGAPTTNTVPPQPESPQSKFAQQNGLQIGEAAIEQERQDEKQARRRPESHHITSQSHPNNNQRDPLRQRPKTAGDASTTISGEASSYEDIFGELIQSPSATHRHSDVSIYATTLQNRYVHHLEEAQKIEAAIKRLGRAHDTDELEDQQEVARGHYVSRDVFRPKSAAPPATQYLPGISYADRDNRVTVSKSPGATTQRAFSASAARPTLGQGTLPTTAKHPNYPQRSATAQPLTQSTQSAQSVQQLLKTRFPPRERVHQHVLVGALPHVDLDAGSVTSPRLHESSAELSNLSEHELPMLGRRKL